MSVDFLDSNVFIYSVDETDALKYQIARRLIAETLQNGDNLSASIRAAGEKTA